MENDSFLCQPGVFGTPFDCNYPECRSLVCTCTHLQAFHARPYEEAIDETAHEGNCGHPGCKCLQFREAVPAGTRMFCACCGVELPDPNEHFCVPCQGHVLKHPEGVRFWKATWAAQHDFKEGCYCPFDVNVER